MTDLAALTRELSAPLTADERQALGEHERVIDRGLKTFVEVGTALTAINESRLYRTTHQSFEAYAKERWNLSRPRAYELMAAAEVMSAMADTDQPPSNERQVRELGKVPEAERADVWRETVERRDRRGRDPAQSGGGGMSRHDVLDGDRLLTRAEVASLFRVEPKTVTRWAQAGRLGSIRTLGGHRRFRESEVRALLDGGDES